MSTRVYTKYFLPVFFLAALIPLVSCQVGLGAAVDTEAPKVAITYPSTAVVIRGHFIIAGTCSDDEGVVSVKVVLTDTDTEKKYDAEAAALGSSKETWQISLNEYDSNAGAGTYNGWALPDGKYTADVTASDAAGRTS
ncbi:MAG: Ig-like domain-containing protein, partial [Treponema sp.]|nr:Ig-like domain-containing protein [Treponema sp.]